MIGAEGGIRTHESLRNSRLRAAPLTWLGNLRPEQQPSNTDFNFTQKSGGPLRGIEPRPRDPQSRMLPLHHSGHANNRKQPTSKKPFANPLIKRDHTKRAVYMRLADQPMEPAMAPNEALTPVFGRLVGTGPGAGMAIIFVMASLYKASTSLGAISKR